MIADETTVARLMAMFRASQNRLLIRTPTVRGLGR